MPQETSLNVAPYFDDFSPKSDYYRVLFKPESPVQARELTSLQSILQNQVEQFGTHFFKEGAKVIPGQTKYSSNFYSVQIESEFLGIPVSLYLDQLVGKKIRGQSSGVVAKVVTYITNSVSEKNNYTIYIDYLESNSVNFTTREFTDGEILITDENLEYSTTSISAGEGFSTVISSNASSTGSAFTISSGVYFLRGHFVNVNDQILILDQYTNTPSYRVGFDVYEQIITQELDPTLNDNSQGFNNYAAPGADRLKITATLAKKSINDFEDQNFIQLATVENGILRDINDSIEYNILGDALATRTFDESGHYYIREFSVFCKESLNNGYGNRGLYNSNQQTSSGNVPSDSIAIYKIGPGKAYVRGYEVETVGPTFLDVPKPRTTNKINNQALNFGFGPTLSVNRVYGSATIGFNTSNTLSLRNDRVGSTQTSAAGKEIGIARIYDFKMESGSYNTSNLNINEWSVSLFDVQTYTDITVNTPVTLTLPTYIKGESSGATAFLKSAVSVGTGLTVYQVNGNFFIGENLVFNGVSNNSRVSIAVTNFGISDVQSVYGIVGTSSTFTADVIQTQSKFIGVADISAASGGISTISTSQITFPGTVSVGNIVRYSRVGFTDKSYAKVTTVSTNSIVISGVTTVTGVCDGGLPSALTAVTDLTVVSSDIQKISGSGNAADNRSLFSILPKENIESIDLINSSLTIRKQFTTNITSKSTATIFSGENEVFLPFDEERYILIRSDGVIEPLSSDKFSFTPGSTELVINGLGTNNTGAILIATLRKDKIKSKSKKQHIVSNLVISKSKYSYSGTGQATVNDGLTYGNYPFGTRVQDDVICLNVPDVVRIYGIFESDTTADPTAPYMTVGSLDGPTSTTNDLILGEEIVGTVSGARALYIVRTGDSSIEFIQKNSISFENGEVITFTTSNVSAIVSQLNSGSKNITKNYTFTNGQTLTHYDYSRILRKSEVEEPKGKLIVYFSKGVYNSSDTGDITTVESYNGYNYTSEIPTVNSIRNTNIIDARPRVVDYTVTVDSRSPFEFYGRSFDLGTTGQHSAKSIIASGESMSLSYSYYLPRIDRIFIDKSGILTVKYGTPSDNPQLPEEVSGAMNIANIALPAYLYSAENVKITSIPHRRYQMDDISRLETRIKNLEYYTSLSIVENATFNSFISDSNGLNRFKSGISVDNFTSMDNQDVSIGVNNCIDITRKELRPSHYSTALNLEIGTKATANQDTRYADILGTNTKRNKDVVTLDYSDTSWLKQPFATRTENVTPFLVKLWEGSIELDPTVDVWIDVAQQKVNAVTMEGSFLGVAQAMRAVVTADANGARSGISPVIWNSWETTGVNVDFNLNSSSSTTPTTSSRAGTADEFAMQFGSDALDARNGVVPSSFLAETTNSETKSTVSGEVKVSLDQQRTGTQTKVTEKLDTSNLGNRIISRNIIHTMRSRNIQFTGKRLKPYTQVYGFFDNIDVNSFCFSKLLEISMSSGVFLVGETVKGTTPTANQTSTSGSTTTISFRVATSNHKEGAYNTPSSTFDKNPYNKTNTIQSTYSATSTILNVDTASLSSESLPTLTGFIRTGMILKGQTSGAEATITNNRLITDSLGTIIGSFLVPDSKNTANPIFETGRNRLRLTSSSIDSKIPGIVTTSAEEIFFSQGDTDNTQETTLTLRNATVDHIDQKPEHRTLDKSDSASTDFTSGTSSSLTGVYQDPLAQSFAVDENTGIFVTKVDLYFNTKDPILPVTLQIREVELGTPSRKILAYSQVILPPDKINLSDDASIPTTFTFDAPVYLQGQKEYALVVISDSSEYNVWISRLGEFNVNSQNGGKVPVSTQRLLGSLFTSQNASTWTPSQYDDLTFEIYRANFVPNGSVQLFNPSLPSDLELLAKDSLITISNNVKIGIGTTVNDSGLTVGNTILQNGSNATGKLVGYGGSATNTLTITNAGVGYTPSSGSYTFTGVALTSYIGSGINATANITVANGVAIGATILVGGQGYTIGDVLSPIQIGSNTLGLGMKLSVATLTGQNQLIVDNVQGEFLTGITNYIKYVNNSGTTTNLNGATVVPSSPITTLSDGLHFKVYQKNHGMHVNTNLTAASNLINVANITSDTLPTTLTTNYGSGDSGSINITSSTNFGTFENVGVATTNPGYVLIGDEIIKYTGISGNTLTSITRGIDDTKPFSYASGDLVYKYELNGVSLRRINTSHAMSDVNDVIEQTNLDYYHVKVDTSTNGVNRSTTSSGFPILHFNSTTNTGGTLAKSTYNIPFELITPSIKTITPTGTIINCSARTISGRSLNGTESEFVDKGFQDITLNNPNYFDSPRIVASDINQSTYLSSLPANKSFTVNMNLSSSDSKLSPAIDLQHCKVVFTSNRINNPITDYANDPRVNSIIDDPNAFYYATKTINLENPATSIQLLVDAYINNYSDVRAFYSINPGASAKEAIFVPFPGYNNLDNNGIVIDSALNDGLPDRKIAKVDSYVFNPPLSLFNEYKFTIDKLTSFNSFRIKLIGTTTNQAVVPLFRNLRIIALA